MTALASAEASQAEQVHSNQQTALHLSNLEKQLSNLQLQHSSGTIMAASPIAAVEAALSNTNSQQLLTDAVAIALADQRRQHDEVLRRHEATAVQAVQRIRQLETSARDLQVL